MNKTRSWPQGGLQADWGTGELKGHCKSVGHVLPVGKSGVSVLVMALLGGVRESGRKCSLSSVLEDQQGVGRGGEGSKFQHEQTSRGKEKPVF